MAKPKTTHEWKLIIIRLNGETAELKTWSRKPEPAEVAEYIGVLGKKGIRIDIPMMLINHVATTRISVEEFLGEMKAPVSKKPTPNPNPGLNVANAQSQTKTCFACNFPGYVPGEPCPECGYIEAPNVGNPQTTAYGTESCLACALEKAGSNLTSQTLHTCGREEENEASE